MRVSLHVLLVLFTTVNVFGADADRVFSSEYSNYGTNHVFSLMTFEDAPEVNDQSAKIRVFSEVAQTIHVTLTSGRFNQSFDLEACVPRTIEISRKLLRTYTHNSQNDSIGVVFPANTVVVSSEAPVMVHSHQTGPAGGFLQRELRTTEEDWMVQGARFNGASTMFKDCDNALRPVAFAVVTALDSVEKLMVVVENLDDPKEHLFIDAGSLEPHATLVQPITHPGYEDFGINVLSISGNIQVEIVPNYQNCGADGTEYGRSPVFTRGGALAIPNLHTFAGGIVDSLVLRGEYGGVPESPLLDDFLVEELASYQEWHIPTWAMTDEVLRQVAVLATKTTTQLRFDVSKSELLHFNSIQLLDTHSFTDHSLFFSGPEVTGDNAAHVVHVLNTSGHDESADVLVFNKDSQTWEPIQQINIAPALEPLAYSELRLVQVPSHSAIRIVGLPHIVYDEYGQPVNTAIDATGSNYFGYPRSRLTALDDIVQGTISECPKIMSRASLQPTSQNIRNFSVVRNYKNNTLRWQAQPIDPLARTVLRFDIYDHIGTKFSLKDSVVVKGCGDINEQWHLQHNSSRYIEDIPLNGTAQSSLGVSVRNLASLKLYNIHATGSPEVTYLGPDSITLTTNRVYLPFEFEASDTYGSFGATLFGTTACGTEVKLNTIVFETVQGYVRSTQRIEFEATSLMPIDTVFEFWNPTHYPVRVDSIISKSTGSRISLGLENYDFPLVVQPGEKHTTSLTYRPEYRKEYRDTIKVYMNNINSMIKTFVLGEGPITSVPDHTLLNNKNSIAVWPNPVELGAMITVKSNLPFTGSVTWINLRGVVLHKQFFNNEKSKLLQVPNTLYPGTWIVVFESDLGKLHIEKIMIQ